MPVLLLVTPTLVSYWVFLRQLAARLSQEGWQVHVATSSKNYPGGHGDRDGTVFHEVDFPRGANPLGYLQAAWQLRQIVRTIQPVIVHAHLQPAILAVALARRRRWPIALGTFQGLVHTTLPHGPQRALYRCIERWASRRLRDVWLLTEDDLLTMPLPNVHLQEAPGFGADQTVFDPRRFTQEHRRDKRAALGVPDDALLFIYVGRQTHFKGFPETALAALQVVSQRPDVHVVLVGTPDPRHLDGLDEARRAQLIAHPQIHMIGWENDVASLLSASDCFVFPSAREGMAVCIMEALSMGLPVVTTPARGCRELVTHGHNGWLVNKDAASLTRQLLWICEHPEELSQRAEMALAERARFSRDRFVDEQLSIYRQIVGSP